MGVERTVAILYCDPRGPYPKMAGVDCWDEKRNALGYIGNHPVVAHPPCAPWSSLRHLFDGPSHQTRLCALRAVQQVRRWGGVLEHPAGSKLWQAAGPAMPEPGAPPDVFGGYSLEVEQVSWGHVARKRTWLYFVRVPRELVMAGLRTGGEPTHWCSGGRKRGKGSGGLVPPGIKVCSAQQRRRTPPAFAEWLVSLARSVQGG